MRAISPVISLAAILALAACGGTTASHPQAAATPAHSATPPHATPTATATPATSSASANAQLFIYALASETSTSIASLRGIVAGPVMPHYLTFQSLQVQALAAAGSPVSAGTVTKIPGGFQICENGVCKSFTDFRSDSRGRITDITIDGQLISARLGIGPDSVSSGLILKNVTSYLSTSTGTVGVAFTVRNTGNQTVTSGSPPFLPVFVTSDGSQLNYDSNSSVMPGPLLPGESSAAIAVFDTRAITGQFSLRANDQTEQILVASEIRK